MKGARLCVAVALCRLAGIWAAAPGAAYAQLAEEADEAIKRLVVMVQCRTPEMDRDSFGAGFLFGADPERLYIATAAHVVSRCAQTSEGVQVEFRGRTQAVKANVLKHTGRPVDLAVLGISGYSALGLDASSVPFGLQGDPAALGRGAPLYALGNPRGIRWGMNASPDTFASLEDDILLFASTFIGEGHSGGTLLDDRGGVVGMIRSDQPPTGEAVSINRVLATLREWKYPVSLHPPFPRVVAGGHITCRVTPDGKADCWGDIGFGATGGSERGTLTLASGRFKSIGAGMFHVCALRFDGTASCRGSNKHGQLGSGAKTDSHDAEVDVQQGGQVFASLVVGGWHTCGLTAQGRAYCWGAGAEGRLGNNAGEDSPVPVPVSGGHVFKSLGSGLRNTCGVTTEGAIYCWGGVEGTGLERYGMDPPNYFVPTRVAADPTFQSVTAGGGHVCGLTVSGAAYCWGANEEGELGTGSPSEREWKPLPVAGGLTFTSLIAGLGGHTCGLTTSTAAYCWGPNGNGEHGNGTTKASNVPVPVSGGITFASIAPGYSHTCGVTTNGEIDCWGSEGLGLGTGSD